MRRKKGGGERERERRDEIYTPMLAEVSSNCLKEKGGYFFPPKEALIFLTPVKGLIFYLLQDICVYKILQETIQLTDGTLERATKKQNLGKLHSID